ncbi:MAG: hypothetical protein PHE33_08790, partial [Bacteroidales bacterium]|nr:hypothetical protein [Bacteroidales bacterium]
MKNISTNTYQSIIHHYLKTTTHTRSIKRFLVGIFTFTLVLISLKSFSQTYNIAYSDNETWTTSSGNLYASSSVSLVGTYIVSPTTPSFRAKAVPEAVTVSGGGSQCGGSMVLTASGGSGGTIYWQGTTSDGTSTTTASSSQSVSVSGIYYFRSRSPEGDWGTEGSATVTLNAAPTAAPDFSLNPICSSSSTTLSANATAGSGSITTYAWSSGILDNNATGSVSSAGTYTVTITDSNNCTVSATTPSLTVKPSPTGVSAGSDVTICNGNSTQLIGSPTGSAIVFQDDFSTDKGWALGTYWSRGSVTTEPSSDHSSTSDNYALACPLNSDYPNYMSTYYATSPEIDCSEYSTVTLDLYGFLGCESSSYDHMGIQVYNGTSWVTIWSNGSSFQESSWTLKTYNVSAYAAGVSNFKIRFYMGTTDGSGTYSGWAIDDIEITGQNGISYSWLPSTGLDNANISYPIASPTTTTTYTMTATATNGCGVSDDVIVTVLDLPIYTAGAIDNTGETICYAGDPGVIGSTTDASGGDGSIDYEWRENDNPIASSNSATYDPPVGLTSTTTYTRFAKDGTCNNTFTQSTGSWVVTVHPNFTAGAINTIGETFCSGDDPEIIGSLTVASGGNGTIVYEWRENDSPIASSNSASYDPPAGLISTTTYTRFAKDDLCNSFTQSTGSWVVTVNPIPEAVTVSGNGIHCAESLTLVATGGTGGTIYWQGTTSDGTITTTASSSQEISESGTYYFRSLSDEACWGPEGSATVTLNSIPEEVIVSSSGTYCASTDLTASAITVKTLGTGTSTSQYSPLSAYHNYSRSMSLILGSELSNSRGKITHLSVYVGSSGSHNFTGIQIRMKETTATTASSSWDGTGTLVWSGSYQFSSTGWVTFDISDFEWTSDNLLITWQHGHTSWSSSYPYFRYTTQSSNLQSGSYNDSSLPTSLSVSTARINYQLTFENDVYWQGTTSNGTSTETPSTSQTVTSSGTYYFRALSSAGCWGPEGSATVTINPAPEAVTVIGGGTQCGGSMTLTASDGDGGTIYWQGTTSDGTSTTTVSSSQSVSESGTYYFRSLSDDGCWGPEGSATVIIHDLAIATPDFSSNPICDGTSTTLSANATAGAGTITTYEWSSGILDNNASGTVSSAGIYVVTITDSNNCTMSAATPSLVVNPIPDAVTVSGSGIHCAESLVLTATGGTGGTIYWQETTSESTSTAIASSSESVTASGTYYFRSVSDEACWGPEGSATVTLNSIPEEVIVSSSGTYCASTDLTASAITVKTLGTGTSTSQYSPLSAYHNYSRSMSLILGSELSNSRGKITHLSVYVGSSGSHNFTGIQIRMKETTATTASSSWDGTGTLVWSGSYQFSSTGWVTFDISDFEWTSDNLLITWQHGHTSWSSSYPYFRYTTQSSNLQSGSYNDSSLPTSLSVSTARINYQLTFENDVYWQGTTSNGTSTETPSTSQTVTSSGTYYFRALSSAGCWGPEGSATVTINPAPEAVTVSGGGTQCGGSMTLTASDGNGGTIYWQGTTSNGTSTTTASSSQSVLESGTYYFRSLSDDGCWGPEGSATVIIHDLPIATPDFSSNPICDGSNTTLSANATAGAGTITTYEWSSGILDNNASGSVSSAGIYVVTITDSNNCTLSAATPSLVVNPIPDAVTVSGSGIHCAESLTLTATGGTGGTIYWQGTTSDGTSTTTASSSQEISESGTYYFRSLSDEGCWGPEGSATVTLN